jgi:TRAP-type C4-dicarboxylate transport system permease small subunit
MNIHKDVIIGIVMCIVILLFVYYIVNYIDTTLTEHPEIADDIPDFTEARNALLIVVYSSLLFFLLVKIIVEKISINKMK